ncbi:ATP-dependent Clp protease ATP-binding subunit ClpA [Coxiella burnetii]|uniref:ATP-dependent clp protease ATP-binding subunit n=3 Tax=Coxiella burnetii TaxID=777 RepID=Q83CD0_COXBU|nr:ATP-dependent Clp protease ATP-binding subunit ClpA [Coxiella burnetii]NP_820191.1 ATP-dependent clp protease ATP-binding subunit [Coxiella burnetii RSA 493]AAO90705.1 ATP-dependent clp protease ATP-binding subunit [Coxiella burnetii RSA 493]ABS78397.1 ATP-dependent clp protease ATP-binding subunit [Coxiella burnetii Dugway 5J108-111]AIT63326.1 ATP-dependent Clp protease ATP-binding subunit ClpA [Coxiella burnetii str. Namibia]ARI65993.1 ATP-dependent Clp protease ATP-binding subunit ClpA [
MFSKALEKTLNRAFSQAREKRHEFITVEHLLLALLDNPEAGRVLSACGANLERLRAGLGIFIDETTPHIPLNVERDIQPTLSFQRVLQRAIYDVQCNGTPEVTGTNILTAIFSEPESQAVYFLSQENISRIDIINYTTQGITKPRQEARFLSDSQQLPEASGMQETTVDENLIELYATNLNAKARSGRVDPLIGRQEELLRCIQTLCRRTKNNPLLVGDAGVGKTAIVEGLAQLIVQNRVPKPLAHATIYALDLGILLAGTKYRGDFEKRFKSVLKALSREPGAVIFIDEIHNLIGAGSATGGTMDASNLIKPLLTTGELRCMGATTYEEFRNFFSKDHALLRRFQRIDVKEPSVTDTVKILQGLRSRYENYHQIRYTPDALKRAVELSARYISDRQLPDKAIDVIDEAGAFEQLQSDEERKTLITVKEIESIVAKMARIPIHTITQSDKELLIDLPKQLKRVVFGQSQAVESLCNAIKLSRAGLNNADKPVGSFLLAGPTGVGKTEVTRQLAQALGIELIRFDMSEYMERHAVSRLIGAPPGYVGFDQGGLLTEIIRKQPHAVLLLDEIEKAHPDIFNILLQVMDYGYLTDNTGRKADFRHVIIVMTTNAGAEQLERGAIGFAVQDMEQENLGAIKHYFSPEFRNRLDAVIQFKYLDTTTILKIVDKFTRELRDQLKEKGIRLTISSDAKQWLAERGYNEKMGARPMARLIQEKLKVPIANQLLFSELNEGDEIIVNRANGDLVVQRKQIVV